MRLLFWRRFAAAWIDIFVVYAVVSFCLCLAAMAGVRLAFGPLFVAVAAVCGVALLVRYGQTIGKALMGIAVESSSGGKPGLGRLLAREVLGKWGLAVVVPIALGRVLLKSAWVPTAYDALMLALVTPLSMVYGLLAKRAWYDRLARTTVNKLPAVAAVPKRAFAALLAAAVLGFGCKATEWAVRGRLPCRLSLYQSMRSTEPYVRFLQQGQSQPVDYVLGLFERYDVVVLCERPHPEASQWDFIFDVVQDPRFVDRVGWVFTEYGNSAMQSYLDEFLGADGLSPAQVHERVVHIMRHWSVWPFWDKVNFYTYLTRLYALNQSLPRDRRIHHGFTDVPVDWSRLTPQTMPTHWRALENRDRQMAERVISAMRRRTPQAGQPPKCLVVMNHRHAFDLTGGGPGGKPHNCYEFIKAAFRDRAANVLLNTALFVPIAGGLWDAAFERTGNRPAGFDFASSPFGQDTFDLFVLRPVVKGRLDYRDVFTGFVFTHPLREQYLHTGIPGYSTGFEPEMRRRAGLYGERYQRLVEGMIGAEERGRVGLRRPLSNGRLESCVELALLSLASVGLLAGLARVLALGMSRRPLGAVNQGRAPGA
jgi:uncharacterized RDD family membrane protein YckC